MCGAGAECVGCTTSPRPYGGPGLPGALSPLGTALPTRLGRAAAVLPSNPHARRGRARLTREHLLPAQAPPPTHIPTHASTSPPPHPSTMADVQVGKDARLDQFFQQPGEPWLTGPSK